MFNRIFTVFLLLLSFVPEVRAERLIDLYTANVLVIDQTPEVRRKAAIDELANVFVRLTGSRYVLERASVKQAIRNANRYLYEFSYQTSDQEITIAGTVYPASVLQLKFSSSPLEAIIREENLPFWPANRPELLMWIAADEGQQNYINLDSDLGAFLNQAAIQYGLPLINPLLDLEDRTALPLSNLWVMDESTIIDASERYSADAVLAGRINLERNRYKGSFILRHQQKTNYFSVTATSRQKIAEAIFTETAAYFADIYALSGNDEGVEERVQVVINNAEDFAVYAEVINYLNSLKITEGSVLTTVKGEQLIFDIAYKGDVARLLQTLALGKKLVFVEERTVFVPQYTDTQLITEEEPLSVSETEDLPIVQDELKPLPAIQEETSILQLVFSWQP